MTSIDFKQKLHDAHLEVFRGEREIILDFFNEDIDLDKSFLELCDAAEGRGGDVSVGTVDELRAILLSDPMILHGGLTPVGPSLRLSWQGKVRKFCLGVDPDAALEGGDGRKLRLLTWSGDWPACHFEDDRGVASMDEFFDLLVGEVAVIQQEAQAVSRIMRPGTREGLAAPPMAPEALSFLDYVAAAIALVAVVLLPASAEIFKLSSIILAVSSAAGLLLMFAGLWHLKIAAENPSGRFGEGLWRVTVGAGFIAAICLWSMLTTAPVWIGPDHIDRFGSHPGF